MSDKAEPFLRWAGGKRWLAPRLAPLIAACLGERGTYREPFLGGGAVHFELAPRRASLSDANVELVAAYRAVRDDPGSVLAHLRATPVDEETYYAVRAAVGGDDAGRAARFVYLNRTCYGGIYRTNRAGRFNVPYAGGLRTPADMLERGVIPRAATALRGIEISDGDFAASLDAAGPGDVVYCDPPYHAPDSRQFDRYGSDVFGWDHQVRLADAAGRAAARGAVVVVSNGGSREVGALYRGRLAFSLLRRKTIGNRAKTDSPHAERLYVLDERASGFAWTIPGAERASAAATEEAA